MKLSPLWYVIDSWPMISAPQNGSGTKRKYKTVLIKQDYRFSFFLETKTIFKIKKKFMGKVPFRQNNYFKKISLSC